MQAKRTAGGLGRLSHDALAYGIGLDLDDPARLAAKLYGYGRRPTRSHGHDRWLTRVDAARAYGLGRRSTTSLLRQHWRASLSEGPWFSWSSCAMPADGDEDGGASDGPTCKVYLSPLPSRVGDALQAGLRAVDPAVTSGFKLAHGPLGFARPDKMVFYVAATSDAVAFARRLGRAVAGLPPHGTPFTCQIGDDELVSIGWDLHALDRQGRWVPLSWRSAVTDRLADGIVLARAREWGTERTIRFAVGRLSRLGLDIAWSGAAPDGVFRHSRTTDAVLRLDRGGGAGDPG